MSSIILSILIVLAILLVFVALVVATLCLLFFKMQKTDRNQHQHSIRRAFPVVSRIRYMAEQISPEIKQYFIDGDEEGKPYSRLDFQTIVRFAKYGKNVISLGSKRDFDKPNQFYIRNAFFAKQVTDLEVDQTSMIQTKKYIEVKKEKETTIDKYKELIFPKEEQLIDAEMKPWLLSDKDAIVVGKDTCTYPMVLKSPIGMSGMSYGALGDHAIEALGIGLKDAMSFMNTGEGGISPYHLKSGVDIIAQIGPAKFGFREKDGTFSWNELKKKAELPQIKAFEIKLGQGAKIRGGHVEASKVTPQVAEIRGVEPWKTIDSPNRFEEFTDFDTMFDFIERIRLETGKPVGIKIVVGAEETFEEFVQYMKFFKRYPDFISIDGGEGGTGATYRAMADSVGLPIKTALMIAQSVLIRHNIRDKVKIFASGKLFSPDRIAIALSMGADAVMVARGFMISVGCIGAEKCASGHCPVGVATQDPKLQQALVIEEKRYRVTNYVTTLREELFMLSASAGLTSPAQFEDKHVVFVDEHFQGKNMKEYLTKQDM